MLYIFLFYNKISLFLRFNLIRFSVFFFNREFSVLSFKDKTCYFINARSKCVFRTHSLQFCQDLTRIYKHIHTHTIIYYRLQFSKHLYISDYACSIRNITGYFSFLEKCMINRKLSIYLLSLFYFYKIIIIVIDNITAEISIGIGWNEIADYNWIPQVFVYIKKFCFILHT